MIVALVFPPFAGSAIHGPHLAGPLLRGVLAKAGVESVFCDLNLLAVESICSPAVLEELIGLVSAGLGGARYAKDHSAAYISCLSRLRDLPAERFFRRPSGAFRFVMQVAREVMFPVPQTFAECLDRAIARPPLARNLYNGFVDELLSFEADCYGFSAAFGEQVYESIELARRLRERRPDARLLIGGSQINLLEQEQVSRLAACGIFDAVSIGNGEQTIVDLATDGGRRGVVTSGGMNREELDGLPPPLFDADLHRYIAPLKLPVLVTKGCYWGKCTFCDYPRLANLGGKRYIARSPEIAFAEIKTLQADYDPGQINLISDAVPPSWYAELAALAVAENVELKSSSYMMHSKSLDDDFFALLSRAGVRTIHFGTESTNERILEIMKKQAKRDVIVENFRLAHRHGIRTVANVIPDYPTITFAEATAVLEDFKRLSPLISSINSQMFDLTAGTPAAADPDQFKLIVKSNAYVRSSHGYHALSFERAGGLTSSQRSFLKKAFKALERQNVINDRIEAFGELDMNSDTMVLFDGSAGLSGVSVAKIVLASADESWAVADFEAAVLKKVFDEYGYLIAWSELRTLFHQAARDRNFDSWFHRLLRWGLIEDLRIELGQSAFHSHGADGIGAKSQAATRSKTFPTGADSAI